MKKLTATLQLAMLLVVLIFALPASGQNGNTTSIPFPGAPTGSCAFIMQAFDVSTGDHYDCGPGAVWRKMATGSVSASWSGLTSPTTDLSLAMGAYNTTFTGTGTFDFGNMPLRLGSLSIPGLVSTDASGNLSVVPNPGTGSNLTSGGGIFCSSVALSCSVTAATYTIQGTNYSSALTTVTFATADATYERFDTIYVDTGGLVGVITGAATPSPTPPPVNQTTQLQIGFVDIPALATAPNVSVVTIYLEDAGPAGEWTMTESTAGARINLASTNFPYAGTKDIEATAPNTNDYFQAVIGTGTVDLTTLSTLTFRIRSKAAWNGTQGLTFAWYSGSTPIGIPVVMKKANAYAFTSSQTTAYQQVTIPLSNWNPTLPVDTLKVTMTGAGWGSGGWYIDNVILQGGTNPINTANFALLNAANTFTATQNLLGVNTRINISGSGTHQIDVSGATIGRFGQDVTGPFLSSDTSSKPLRLLTNNGTLHTWLSIDQNGVVNLAELTASRCVHTDASSNLTSTAGDCAAAYTLPTQYTVLHCEAGLGDGLNAITAGTYPILNCHNNSAVTWTITGISCYTDNTGTSTLAAANNAGTALLTAPVTCTAVKSTGGAPGSQSATVTLAAGDGINFSFISDGSTQSTTWFVTLTQ